MANRYVYKLKFTIQSAKQTCQAKASPLIRLTIPKKPSSQYCSTVFFPYTIWARRLQEQVPLDFLSAI